MSVPLRKDQTEENLTTADLAQTRRPSPVETMRSKPPMSESEPLEPRRMPRPLNITW